MLRASRELYGKGGVEATRLRNGEVGQFWQLPVVIPKGCKLIAVGERCATPTDSIDRKILTLKGPHYQFDPFRLRRRFVDKSVGVAQRSPTAINLNPFGIGSDRNPN